MSSLYDSKVSGFLRSGRLRVIVATLPSTCQVKCRGLISIDLKVFQENRFRIRRFKQSVSEQGASTTTSLMNIKSSVENGIASVERPYLKRFRLKRFS